MAVFNGFLFLSSKDQIKMWKFAILSSQALPEKNSRFCHKKTVFRAKSIKIGHTKTALEG
jgi:hypothetical protein